MHQKDSFLIHTENKHSSQNVKFRHTSRAVSSCAHFGNDGQRTSGLLLGVGIHEDIVIVEHVVEHVFLEAEADLARAGARLRLRRRPHTALHIVRKPETQITL